MIMFKVNDVVQFNENHKWCGCLGIIDEVHRDRYLVGVPVPQSGAAYIFVMDGDDTIEYIGDAVMVSANEK